MVRVANTVKVKRKCRPTRIKRTTKKRSTENKEECVQPVSITSKRPSPRAVKPHTPLV